MCFQLFSDTLNHILCDASRRYFGYQNYSDWPKGMLLYMIYVINHVTSQSPLIILMKKKKKSDNNASHLCILGITKITPNGLKADTTITKWTATFMG